MAFNKNGPTPKAESVAETIEEPVTETPVEEIKPKSEVKKEKVEMVVDTELLNVRKKPGDEVVGRVSKNTIVTVDSVKDDWAKISKPFKGYCMVQYLR